MCFGIIRSQLRDWYVRQKAGKDVKLRSVDEILIRYKESFRAHVKAGREENRKDASYYAGAIDALRWVMGKK